MAQKNTSQYQYHLNLTLIDASVFAHPAFTRGVA